MSKELLGRLFVDAKQNRIKSAPRSNDDKREYNLVVNLSEISDNTIDTKAVFIKGDRNSSILNINIIKNGRPFNLTGYTITANVRENMNFVETFPCNIVSAEEGTVRMSIPSNYVDEEGKCTFDLSLQKSSTIIMSQKYSYDVLQSVGEGEPGTPQEMTVLQQLIEQVHEKSTTVNNIVRELEVTQQDVDDIMNMIGGL